MQPKIIKTDEEHDVALARIEVLMDDAEPGSPEEMELEALAIAVEQYEKVRFPMD